MNQQQIAERLAQAMGGREYTGPLTPYAVQSIEKGRSNYPVSNLLAYCRDSGLEMVMTDMTTEDRFHPTSVLEVHRTLGLLMDRYEVDCKLVHRKTATHYTAPKSLDEQGNEDPKVPTPLSVKTLIAVCEVIHCDLSFVSR